MGFFEQMVEVLLSAASHGVVVASLLLDDFGQTCSLPADVAHVSHATASHPSSFTESCSKSLEGLVSKPFDYVCDTTVPWLHYSREAGSWAEATPPAGSGCHSYVYLHGTPPPNCSVGHACD